MQNHDKNKHKMAWNEPGNNNDDKDPWNTDNNKSRRKPDQQGPPDLDDILKNINKMLGQLFGGKKNGSGGSSNIGNTSKGSIAFIAFVIIALWSATGFYKVEEAERGVVIRFGHHVETVQKGLHWHFPTPIETVEKVDITKIYTIPIQSTMLTEDENIVDIHGTVQYQIDSAEKYLFNVRNPDHSLSQVTESALRQSIGRSKMGYVITEGRGEIAVQVKQIIQGIVNNYQTGLTIFKVNIQSAKPPEQVKDAFDDVTQAREDEERYKNEAEAYRNEVLPKARGKAARVRAEADAYKNEVIANAEGEAQRFTKLVGEYKKAPKITRARLYIDMMESVLANSSKVMVDVKGGNNLLYLPLDKLMDRKSLNKTNEKKKLADDLLKDIKQRGKTGNSRPANAQNLRTRGAR